MLTNRPAWLGLSRWLAAWVPMVLPLAAPAWSPAWSTPGSRPGSDPTPALCVITPRVETGEGGGARALLPISRPTIFVREPLAQVRLRRGTTVLWQRQAGPGGALHGPIAWPLPPLRPGERLQLQLQPQASGPAAFATIDLQAATAATLRRNDARLAALGVDAQAWREAVERALQRGDTALATALLFAFEGPSAEDLDALRQEAFAGSCR